MGTGAEPSVLDFVLVLARAGVIGALLWGVGRLIEAAPIARERRRRLRRVFPFLVLFVSLVFLMSAAQELFGPDGLAVPMVFGFMVLALVAALWWPLRDLVAGVLLRAGNILRPGDDVEIAGISGRVERLGLRCVVLLASKGEVVLPYGAVARSAIVRSRASHGTTTHLFRVERRPGVDPLALRRAITEAALQCHWASISRPPQVRPLGDGALEVTVFALEERFGPAIEAAVIERVAAMDAAPASPGD